MLPSPGNVSVTLKLASTFLSPYLLSNTQDLSDVNVVSAFYTF